MAENPFDDVIDSDKKKPRNKNEDINVSFSINKRWLERLIFILIILLELYFILANPLCSADETDESITDPETNKETANQELQTDASETTEEEKQQNESVSKIPAEQEEELNTEDKNAEVTFDDGVDFWIDKIAYDEDDEGNPLTMEKMEIVIKNNWREFNPRIEVYWYEKNADEAIKQMKRADKTLGMLETGKKYTFTLNNYEFSPKYFLSHDKEIVKVILYEGDMALDSVTEIAS